MKKLIILTGKSGIGKTTSWYPTLTRELGAIAIPTGAIFQSLYGLATIEQTPDYVATGSDALAAFFGSPEYYDGLAAYESFKASTPGAGRAIIRFIECMRAGSANLPASLVASLIQGNDGQLFVTDAINEVELKALTALCFGRYRPYQVALDCLDPVRRDGDNRQPASRSPALELAYSLSELDGLMPSFTEQIKNTIGY